MATSPTHVEAEMDVIKVKAIDDINTEEPFYINDITMGISPSDVQVFDDNYVYEQSFVRSNAVYCYRSKHSDTKVVLNFPFQIGPFSMGSESDASNNTYNCLKLITELNSYPFCFIKSPRLRTYVSPRLGSETGYMIFAVDELALVQSVTASNVMFLEVTLRYFNHSPLTPDFKFVSNRLVDLADSVYKSETESVKYDQPVVEKMEPEIVSSLEESVVWQDYIHPKIMRLFRKLSEVGILKQFRENPAGIHPALNVNLYVPIINSLSASGEGYLQEADGWFLGPGSRRVIATDIDKLDSEDASVDLIAKALNQDFSEDTIFKDKKGNVAKTPGEIAQVRKGGTVSSVQNKSSTTDNPFMSIQEMLQSRNRDISRNKSTQSETILRQDSQTKFGDNDEVASGVKELFIQYYGKSFSDLGMAISKIEVRRRNSLAAHRIGTHKHPIIQYMGRQPATTQVYFTSQSDGIYKAEEGVGINAFFNNILQVLDENREHFPEAEAYNCVKVYSLATLLLGVESSVPNQNLISASANQAGVETIAMSFAQSTTEELAEDLDIEASGAKSVEKAKEEVYAIITQWLQRFSDKLKTGNYLSNGFKAISNDSTVIDDTLKIYKMICSLTAQAIYDLGYYYQPDEVIALDIIDQIKNGEIESGSGNVERDYYELPRSVYQEKYKYLGSEISPLIFSSNHIISNSDAKEPVYSPYHNAIKNAGVIGDQTDTDESNGTNLSTKFKPFIKSSDLTKRTFNLAGYHYWFSTYAIKILTDRINLDKGISPQYVKNTHLQSGSTFNSQAIALVGLISSGTEDNPVSSGLTVSQKTFLKNMQDLYIGSFFGQTLGDLLLSDLVDNYKEDEDVVIQATDPFFFCVSTPLITDELESYYNATFTGDLTPIADILNSDYKQYMESNLSEVGNYLDANIRKLKEVEFNPSNYTINAATGGAMYQDSGYMGYITGKPNVKAAEAIENALAAYGLSSNEAFRKYMYKVASHESTFGVKLYNSGSGAQGLFQIIPRFAFADVLSTNHSIPGLPRNVPKSQMVNTAINIAKNPDFRTNYELNARIFIEYYNMYAARNGRPFNEVEAFSYHNLGTGGAGQLMTYLTKGVDVSNGNIASNTSNGSPKISVWYQEKKKLFDSLNVDNLLLSTNNSKKTETPQIDKNSSILVKQATGVNTVLNNMVSVLKPPTKAGGRLAGVTVTHIMDGDTLTVFFKDGAQMKNQEIRIYGYNTPESFDNFKTNADLKKWAKVAKDELTKLVMAGPVNVDIVSLDTVSSKRLVGVVTTVKDGKNVAIELLKKGLGDVPTNYARDPQYLSTQNQAMKSKLGIWSGALSPEELANQKVNTQPLEQSDILKGATDSTLKRNRYQPLLGGPYRESSDFSYGRNRKVNGHNRPHKGLDIACPIGTVVVSAATGIATVRYQPNGYGNYILIDHGNGFATCYAHLSKVYVKSGQRIASQQQIGLSGIGGTGAHLHYEVRFGRSSNFFDKTPIHPYSTKFTLDKYDSNNVAAQDVSTYNMDNASSLPGYQFDIRKGITEENTIYNEDKLAQAIIDDAKKYVNIGLKAAVPSIKVYMVIGSENDGLGLDNTLTGSLYYELKGVQSFKLLCNDDNNPVDTAIMTVINPNFNKTDAWTNLASIPEIQFDKIGTDLEMQYKYNRLMLKTGSQIQVRLGYGNDPNELEIVFNGGIMEINNGENNQMLTLLLEGYGKELLQEIFNTGKPQPLDNDRSHPTTKVLAKSLMARSIDHFGRQMTNFKWLVADESSPDPEARDMGSIINPDSSWFFSLSPSNHKSRLYMNIFAPEIESVDEEFKTTFSSILSGMFEWNHMLGYPFFVYRMTPWDCCKQMEFRHPGTIFKPMIFEDRMTPFYGVKEQMYFARDLSKYTQLKVAGKVDRGLRDQQTYDYYMRRRERMKPSTNIHIVSSSTNLISNQLALNGDWKTRVSVNYFTDNDQFAKEWEWDSVTMAADDNLLPWQIKDKEVKASGIHGRYTAFLYGTTALKKEAETMYGGKIFITGNPSLKAGDYIFIDDVENRMTGLALVRECIHHFDPQYGFVTELTPGAYVEPANFMYSNLWIKLMGTFKLGTSKIRLIANSNYNSDFAMIYDYIKIMHQLYVSSGDNPSIAIQKNQSEDFWLEVGSVAPVVGLHFYTQYSLWNWLVKDLPEGAGKVAKMKRLFKVLPGNNLARFATFTASSYLGLLDSAKETVATRRLTHLNNFWDTSKQFGSKVYTGQKAKLVGSKFYQEAIQKAKSSSSAQKLSTVASRVKGSWMYKGGAWASRFVYQGVSKQVLKASLAAMKGIALSNPIGIIADIIFTVTLSWAFAKVEEASLTRQPLLFFPLIKHGKPYVGGMVGAKRNTQLQSWKEEFDKTMASVSKAAAVLQGANTAKGKDSSFLTEMLASGAIDKQYKNNGEKFIMTATNPNTTEKQTVVEKQSNIDSKIREQKNQLDEAINDGDI